MRRIASLVTLAASLAFACAGCGSSLEAAAAKDPMKCERDPNCQKKQRAADCSTQCSDDPACVDRCREINQGTGAASPR